MSTTDSSQPSSAQSGPRYTRGQLRDLSTLRRAKEQRMVAGVAEGLSRHFDIDPLLIRVVLAALTLFGGAGIAIYVIAWVTIPEEGKYDSPLSRLIHRDPVRVMSAGLVVAAVIGIATMVGTIGFSAPNPVPLIVLSGLAIGAFALFSRNTRRVDTPPPPVPTAPPEPTSATLPLTEPTMQTTTPSTDSRDAPAGVAAPDTSTTEPARDWWQRPAEPPPGMPPPLPPGSFPPPPPPRSPSRPRSHLFAVTMAVTAIAIGLLWILNETSYPDIPASAYPATVLGVTALGLIVGAWFGRSRLLIAVGIIASLVTAGTAALGDGPYGQQIFRPTDAAMVQSHYNHGVGQMVVHLEYVHDPAALLGRVVEMDQHIGQLQVIVPSSLPVRIAAHVDHGEIAGPTRSGVTKLDQGGQQVVVGSVGPDASALVLDLHLDFGQILITQFDCPSSAQPSPAHGLPTAPTRPLQTTSRIGGFHAAPACH